MSVSCDAKGIASENKHPAFNSKSKSIAQNCGDATVQTTNSLRGLPKTFKDELHTIIESWRNIYGKPPWAELAEKFNYGDVSVVSEIIKLRESANLKVQSYFPIT